MDHKKLRLIAAMLAILCAAALHGCGYRGNSVPLGAAAPETTETLAYTVEYRLGDELLGSESVAAGQSAAENVSLPEGLRFIAWTDETGARVDAAATPVTENRVYYALARPVLSAEAKFLFPDEHGLLRPESAVTYAEAAAALRALASEAFLPAEMLEVWDAAPDEALTRPELLSALEALFDPDEADAVFAALPESEADTAARAELAFCLTRLLKTPDEAEDLYFPDVSPEYWASRETLAAAEPGPLTREAVVSMTRDRFLWFDGYLYCVGDNGYFLADTEFDGLYFDKNGRYTSGNAELDEYVAQTLMQYMTPDGTRLDDLKAIYYHVKNDFQYLTRNYYDSGATGWDIDEALTIFRTNKGNCYCYAGAFCALARGLGYNARTYSGSLGIQNQPHAWTEITLDGETYICDPEIEMNYWMLEQYTDNFMMPLEDSLGWNYQAVGRE